MKGEWTTRRLGDLLKIKHGFAFKGDHFRPEGNEIVLTPGNFRPDGGLQFRDGKEKFYAGPYPDEFRLKAGDLLVVMTDLTQEARILGAPARIGFESPLLHNQRLGKVVDLSPVLEENFLYHLFNSTPFRQHLIATATGSTVKHTAPSRIYDYTFALPPFATQRRIADILCAYDNLIENNTRRIAILEDMARRMFEEWFVHRRLPSNLANDDDWIEGTVGDAFTLQRGFDLPTSERSEGPYPVVAASGVHGFHREWKVRGPGVTTGRSGTIGQFQYIENDFWPLNTSLWIKEFKHGGPLFAYYLLSSLDLSGSNTGAAVPSLNRNIVHSMPTTLPPLPMVSAFEDIVGDMRRGISALTDANTNLRTTRDLLLPKLISGEIEVRAAEEALETAAA